MFFDILRPSPPVPAPSLQSSFCLARMEWWTNGPIDQYTNGPMDQWTNGPIDPTERQRTPITRLTMKEMGHWVVE